ncbi:MAG: replication restart DNA helicase PriA [Cyanobacteria bacterium P01_E01_bin.34]
MTTTQTIPFPNCGKAAIRIYDLDPHCDDHCPDNLLNRTECPVCDYVLSTCTLSGSVVEAYAPGIQLMLNRGESKI